MPTGLPPDQLTIQPAVPAQGGKAPVPMGGMLGGGGNPMQPQVMPRPMPQVMPRPMPQVMPRQPTPKPAPQVMPRGLAGLRGRR
jgi:hypothetical protein